MKIRHFISLFKILGLTLILSGMGISQSFGNESVREFYQLKIYHLKDLKQQGRVEKYLKDALLPALHRLGINKTGVLKNLDGDTTGLKIYILIPFKSMDELLQLPDLLKKDKVYTVAGSDYLDAPFDNPPYARFETIILKSFKDMPVMEVPVLPTPRSERIYELRSYESATEKIHQTKLKMFNEGGEIGIFKHIGSKPVFFGQVIAGSHMPNLMYLTAYADKASREEHWNIFRQLPEWKKLSAIPEYLNVVSGKDIIFLYPTDYSDF